MAERATTLANVPKTYAELRQAVEATMVQGQRLIEQAKVRTYHETGRLIQAHVLLFQDRADYGAGTIRRLGADLKVDRSVLHRCVRFFECRFYFFYPILFTRITFQLELIPLANQRRSF